MVERQTDAEDVLFGRRTLEPTLHVWDVIQVDVLLIDDEAIELDHRDVGGLRTERLLKQRIVQHLGAQWLEVMAELPDHGVVRPARLLLLQLADPHAGRAPFVGQRPHIRRLPVPRPFRHEMDVVPEGRATGQIHVVVHQRLICVGRRHAFDAERHGFVEHHHHDQNSTRTVLASRRVMRSKIDRPPQ